MKTRTELQESGRRSSCVRGRRGRLPFSRAVCLGALLPLAACDGFLDVENPASLLDEDLDRPELLETLANTPEGNITGAYSSLLTRAGLLADELFHPTTQLENIDAMRGNRLASNSAVEGHWRDLAQVRWLADEIAVRLATMVDNPGSYVGIARAHFFGGLARITMADHYNVIVYGPEDGLRGPIDVIRDAIESFELAAQVAAAAGDANLEAAALGQIARAYRSLYFEEMHLRGNTDPGLFAQAESTARQALDTKSDYNVSLRFGAPGGSNSAASLGGPFGGTNRIDEVYLFLPDPVTGNWDPRIPHEEKVVTEPISQTSWNLKFPKRESPLPVSRAAESMLIIAEARLLAGDLDGAVEWINQTRAAARIRVASPDWADAGRGWPPQNHVLSDLSDFASSDAEEIQAQLVHERRAEFWMELRRWQDMRYYRIYPDRWFETNKAMGLDLRWPPSPEEVSNNPNLSPALASQVYVSQ